MIKVEVNQLVGKKIPASFVTKAVAAAAKGIGLKNISLSVAFVGGKAMRELNRKWRGKNKITDVLSFGPVAAKNFLPMRRKGDLGEVIIAYEEAAREAKKKRWPFKQEVALLLVHGVLHCAGYDHETLKQEKEMFTLQEKILVDFSTRP